MNNRKKYLIFSLVFLLAVTGVFGRESYQYPFSPLGDGIALGVGGALSVGSLFLPTGIVGSAIYPPTDIDLGHHRAPSELLPADRSALYPYDKGIDITSDVFVGLSLAAPLALGFLTESDQWLSLGVMYLESMMFTYTVKELLKFAIIRYRPYVYDIETDPQLLDNPTIADSLPSGHTAMAFQAAAFFIYMTFALDLDHKALITFSSSFLALGTAAFRYFSGSHFFSDILAGAALGALIGILTPLFHQQKLFDDSLTLSFSGNGLQFGYRF